jgi:hypothetical protein
VSLLRAESLATIETFDETISNLSYGFVTLTAELLQHGPTLFRSNLNQFVAKEGDVVDQLVAENAQHYQRFESVLTTIQESKNLSQSTSLLLRSPNESRETSTAAPEERRSPHSSNYSLKKVGRSNSMNKSASETPRRDSLDKSVADDILSSLKRGLVFKNRKTIPSN